MAAIPIGVGIGYCIWQAGMGSLFALMLFVPIAVAALCLLATRLPIVIGLVFSASVAGMVAFQGMMFDMRMGSSFNWQDCATRFALVFVPSALLSLLVAANPLYRWTRKK